MAGRGEGKGKRRENRILVVGDIPSHTCKMLFSVNIHGTLKYIFAIFRENSRNNQHIRKYAIFREYSRNTRVHFR